MIIDHEACLCKQSWQCQGTCENVTDLMIIFIQDLGFAKKQAQQTDGHVDFRRQDGDLERLDKGVKQDSHTDAPPVEIDSPTIVIRVKYCVKFPEKLDQSRRSKEFEKSNLEKLCDVDDAADNCDKVKCVPRVLEVVLKQNGHLASCAKSGYFKKV